MCFEVEMEMMDWFGILEINQGGGIFENMCNSFEEFEGFIKIYAYINITFTVN